VRPRKSRKSVETSSQQQGQPWRGWDEHWPPIRSQLLSGTYQPQPVKRVEIPKPDGGIRKLGVPCVVDRLIQQALLQVLQEQWDPTFSEHILLFNRHPQDALDRAEEALKLDPAAVWIETNVAHALLFLNRFDEAKAVYLKYKNTRVDDGRLFSAAVKDDFAQFRKFGIDTTNMKRIEALL
jgi:hypothetical protein